MKIVYLFNSSVPSFNANSLQVVNMCNAISKSIGRVTLITPNTGLKQSLSEHYGIKKNFEMIKIRKFNKFPQGYKYYLFSIYSVILGIKLNSDLFITRNYFTLFILLIFRKKIIFEIHNDLSNEGRINNFIVKYFKILNSKNIIKLIFITNSVKKFFLQNYKVKHRNSLILSSASNFKTFLPKIKKRKFLKIGYFGLVNKSRGLDFLCKLSQIDHKNEYYIYGCSKNFKNLYKKKNLKILIFISVSKFLIRK